MIVDGAGTTFLGYLHCDLILDIGHDIASSDLRQERKL